MNTRWIFFLTSVALALGSQGPFGNIHFLSSQGQQVHIAAQQATPYPLESDVPVEIIETITPEKNAEPRPPSEAGQNLVLIIGAVLLVLIVFLGVGMNLRKPQKKD